jgi:hypothetical protein
MLKHLKPCNRLPAELYGTHALIGRYGYASYRSGYFVADRPELNRAVFDRLRAGGTYHQVLIGWYANRSHNG